MPNTSDAAGSRNSEVLPQAGRPREFVAEDVIEAVVDLFWTRGYATTSIGDVVERTGLSKSSLYGAFGSKDELFHAALAAYTDNGRAHIDRVLTNANGDIDVIEDFLDRGAEDAAQGRGCLIVNSCTERGADDPAVQRWASEHRSNLHAGFSAALRRAVENGTTTSLGIDDIDALATQLVLTLFGIGVLLRGGAPAEEIRTAVDAAKSSLRHLLIPRRAT